eukprot:6016740-Prymnesium_polylepis.1
MGVPLVDVLEAQQAAREAVGAQKGDGGMMIYFMMYDIGTTALCVLVGLLIILVNGYGWGDWILWEVFELARMIQSLLSVPFMLFLVPVSYTHLRAHETLMNL